MREVWREPGRVQERSAPGSSHDDPRVTVAPTSLREVERAHSERGRARFTIFKKFIYVGSFAGQAGKQVKQAGW